jgi:hypothetical protein
VSRGQDPLPQAHPIPTTPAPELEKHNEAAVLEEPACETAQPTPVVTSEVLINGGAGQGGGKHLAVANQEAK